MHQRAGGGAESITESITPEFPALARIVTGEPDSDIVCAVAQGYGAYVEARIVGNHFRHMVGERKIPEVDFIIQRQYRPDRRSRSRDQSGEFVGMIKDQF